MSSRNKSILIAGYYGFRNIGDEAILSALLCSLRAIRPDLDVVVVSGHPEETAIQHGVRSILWIDLPAILEEVRQSDLIILGGGGLFADYWGTYPDTLLTSHHGNNSFYGGFPILAELNDKPCMMYSVGVGPLQTEEGRHLTRMAFELADAATVRDAESRGLVESLAADCGPIRVSADPAFNLSSDTKTAAELIATVRRKQGEPVIGVSLRSWERGVSQDMWEKEVAEALDQVVETHGASLLFVPMQMLTDEMSDDARVAKNVTALMRHRDATAIVLDNHSPSGIAGIIAECDLVVGMRLHSLIFALKEAVPAVGIVYDPKVSNLMSRLDMQEYAIDLITLTSQKLSETLRRAWQNRLQIRSELMSKVTTLKSLAAEDARLAIQLLDSSVPRRAKSSAAQHMKQFTLKRVQLLAEKVATIQTLTACLAEKERTLGILTENQSQLLEEREELNRLLAEREQTIQHYSEQLRARESELIKIKSSVGWRLLALGERISRRYVTPVYRMLRRSIAQSRQ